jgi:hypothetical protein
MLWSKRARDKGFEVTVPKQFPNDDQERREQFFRTDEGDRLARARRWLKQARGDSPTANLQGQRDGKGR